MNDFIKPLLLALFFSNISCVHNDKKNEIEDPYGNKTYFSDDFENFYESIIDNFENDSAAKLYVQATFFLRDDKLDSAKYFMIESFKMESNNKMLLKDLGILYMHLEQLDSAKKYLNKSIRIDSTYSLALNVYGLVFYSQDSNSTAISNYNRAIKYDPTNSSIYYNKALAYQQLGYMDSSCINLKLARRYTSNIYREDIEELIDEINCD